MKRIKIMAITATLLCSICSCSDKNTSSSEKIQEENMFITNEVSTTLSREEILDSYTEVNEDNFATYSKDSNLNQGLKLKYSGMVTGCDEKGALLGMIDSSEKIDDPNNLFIINTKCHAYVSFRNLDASPAVKKFDYFTVYGEWLGVEREDGKDYILLDCDYYENEPSG